MEHMSVNVLKHLAILIFFSNNKKNAPPKDKDIWILKAKISIFMVEIKVEKINVLCYIVKIF